MPTPEYRNLTFQKYIIQFMKHNMKRNNKILIFVPVYGTPKSI